MKKSTVNYYLRLQFHRIAITEGIRLAARRNNNHLLRIQSKLGSSITPGRLGYAQVQNSILEDQGVEKNRINRTVLQFATWVPWEMYLCLLSEEIRTYKQAAKGGLIPRMNKLDEFLISNSTVMSELAKFRERVLHPESGQSSGQVYPNLFEDLIRVYYAHFDTIIKAQYLMDMYLATIGLRLTKSKKIEKLVGLPLPLINDWEDRGELHTSIPSKVVWPCLEAFIGLDLNSETEKENQTITKYAKVGYLMMLIRSRVLISETIHQLFFMGKLDAEIEQKIECISAPMKVGATLLYPGLRRYMEISSARPELRNDLLDEFVGDNELMRILSKFRNAVFHIAKYSVDIENLSQSLFDLSANHRKLEDISSGLLDFFCKIIQSDG